MATRKRIRKSTAAKHDAYRRVVLESAEELFAEHGVAATKVDEIARAAEIAPRTLYSVFSSKDEIARELREARSHELIAHSVDRARAGESPLDRLLLTLCGSVEFFIAHPEYLRIELFEGLFWADEKFAQAESWHQSFTAYSRLFQRCIRDGSVRPGDPRAYARALLAIQQSQLAEWIAAGRKANAERTVNAVVDLFVHAFCTDPTAARAVLKT